MSNIERLRDEIIEAVREFTELVDSHDREKTMDITFRTAGRFEALLEWYDRAAKEESAR